ncbi:hypothetical protein D1BOALGB6SA_3459 [Olavius sp. associated proteobacterium Delta 1]|nr:hypothetical protein D1BOALGB6SA_3459 [Olavius sp. associated proteobacterium Delta 1]
MPFDLAQGGELVEPFEIWILVLGILMSLIKSFNIIISVN